MSSRQQILLALLLLSGAVWWSTRRALASGELLDEIDSAIDGVLEVADAITKTRGERNNNPGNIRRAGIDWQGARAGVNDAAFEEFDTPESGIRALGVVLLNYQRKHGLRTVRGIVNRWAPPSENDTGAYVLHVAKRMGVDADAQLDLEDRATLRRLVDAIITHENGRNLYAATGELDAGLARVA